MSQGTSTWDPVKTVCNINLARGVVLGDKMYVDGGDIMDEQYYQSGTDNSTEMTWWQSEFPSICALYYLIDCHLTESNTSFISR